MRILSGLGLSVLLGCGGVQKAPVSNQANQANQQGAEKPSTATRLATAYNGPKMRVAVGEFKELEGSAELFKNMGWSGVAPSLTDQITTALVQTGRVAVLERQQLNRITGNLDTEKNLSKYFNKKTTAKTGKLLGAQAVLVGAVTEFEPNVSGVSGGIDIPKLGGLTYHADKAVVGIDVRLVHQETGKILIAASGKGEIDSKKLGGGGTYAGVEFGGQAWSRTPLGVAMRTAATQAIEKLIVGLKVTPWEGKVVSASGQKAFIGAGHDLNLKAGDTFELIRRGDAIKDGSGTIIGYDETTIGTVVLKSIQAKMSIGSVSGDKPAQAGDCVRLKSD